MRRRAAGELIDEAELDWPHVAEETEGLGKSERWALASHIATIIEHLAKLEASPATDPRAGWQETVLRARADIDDILDSSPSLRRSLDDVVARQHKRSLRLAAAVLALHNKTPRVPLDGIRYTTAHVLGPWFPAD